MKAFWRVFAFRVLHSELIDKGSLDLNSWLFICIVTLKNAGIGRPDSDFVNSVSRRMNTWGTQHTTFAVSALEVFLL